MQRSMNVFFNQDASECIVQNLSICYLNISVLVSLPVWHGSELQDFKVGSLRCTSEFVVFTDLF